MDLISFRLYDWEAAMLLLRNDWSTVVFHLDMYVTVVWLSCYFWELFGKDRVTFVEYRVIALVHMFDDFGLLTLHKGLIL